jgi:hypothetical protein
MENNEVKLVNDLQIPFLLVKSVFSSHEAGDELFLKILFLCYN